MRKLTIPVLALASLAACRSSQPATPTTAAAESKPMSAPAAKFVLNYPDTRKSDQKDDYFGTSVADPYRWLEDLDSPETKNWVTAENKVTFGYLDQIPFRDKIRERLTTLWNYEKFGIPQQEGEMLYFSKNDGLQNQAVLYAQAGPDGTPEVLLDPNKFSSDGTTALAGTFFSHDHRYMAYATSGGGSDWQKMKVMDLKTRQTLDDNLEWVKVSGASWYKNGFFYSRYDAPKAGENSLAGKNEFHKVYYHTLGKPQSTDRLVYEDPKSPLGFRYVGTTDDERFLSLYLTDSKADGNRVSVRDLTDRKQEGTFTPIITSYEFNNSVVGNVGDKLLVLTNNGAPNYRVVLIDPKKPQEKNWKTVLPETQQKLEGVDHVGGYLVASYLKDASSLIKVYTEKGRVQARCGPAGHRYGLGLRRQARLEGSVLRLHLVYLPHHHLQVRPGHQHQHRVPGPEGRCKPGRLRNHPGVLPEQGRHEGAHVHHPQERP